MPIPEIGPMPPAPIRGSDSSEEFASKANDMMARLPPFRDELEAFRVAVNDVIPTLNDASDLKADLESLNGQTQDLIDQLTLNYSEERVQLDGDFNPGQEIVCVRTGNVVTITGAGPLSHDPGTSAASPSFTIPVGFRPTTVVNTIMGSMSLVGGEYEPTGFTVFTVTNDGYFELLYRDFDGTEASANRSASTSAPTISYVIASQVG